MPQGIILLRLFLATLSIFGEPSAHAMDGATSKRGMAYVGVKVEDISYAGEDSYRIRLALVNNSSDGVTVVKADKAFFLQKEIIGQWHPLEASTVKALAGPRVVPPGGRSEGEVVLKIPPEAPRIYKNAFGEVNLRFTYQLRLAAGEGGSTSNRSGESFYWVTPRTDKWVLREGM